MASFMSKALEYLGLKEFDDEEEYFDEEEYEEPAPRRAPAPRRVQAEREYEREPRLVAEPVTQVQPGLRLKANPLRPVPLDETPSAAPMTVAPAVPSPSVVRPIVANQSPIAAQPIVHIVTPHQFENAQEVAHAVKSGKSVIINLVNVDPDLTRRLVDFCAGLTMGIEGKLERVTEKVFLLTPNNVTISNDERTRLRERGFSDL